ncbi:unnamed protein product, partial [Owenia fusiformis]
DVNSKSVDMDSNPNDMDSKASDLDSQSDDIDSTPNGMDLKSVDMDSMSDNIDSKVPISEEGSYLLINFDHTNKQPILKVVLPKLSKSEIKKYTKYSTLDRGNHVGSKEICFDDSKGVSSDKIDQIVSVDIVPKEKHE